VCGRRHGAEAPAQQPRSSNTSMRDGLTQKVPSGAVDTPSGAPGRFSSSGSLVPAWRAQGRADEGEGELGT
jgi:hypothetical protein